MKLTFVIPAYNEESCIGRCLQSILEETKNDPDDFEIIVVNNGSADQTKKIARSFPGVKVIDEPEKGLAKARQTGYLASNGELIANVDADNVLPRGWVAKTLYEFSKNKNLVGLSGPLKYYDLPRLTGVLVNIFYILGFGLYVLNHFIIRRSGMLQGGNFIIRKSALDEIGGFNTAIKFYGEDTDVAMRLQKLGLIKFSFLLPMYSSGRRLKNEGILTMFYKYIANYFWIILFRRPFHKEDATPHPVESKPPL
ncbi:MAG: glycosyltransferase family 2 protein [Patescibacteria group bacterium]